MEYFVLQDFGYDGIVINKFNTKEEAEKYYDETLKPEQEKYEIEQVEKRKYGIDYKTISYSYNTMLLIEGNILRNDNDFFRYTS